MEPCGTSRIISDHELYVPFNSRRDIYPKFVRLQDVQNSSIIVISALKSPITIKSPYLDE